MLQPITAESIRALRKRLMLTQAEFAEQLGVSSQAISFWELGQRSPTGLSLNQIRMLMQRDETEQSTLSLFLVRERSGDELDIECRALIQPLAQEIIVGLFLRLSPANRCEVAGRLANILASREQPLKELEKLISTALDNG